MNVIRTHSNTISVTTTVTLPPIAVDPAGRGTSVVRSFVVPAPSNRGKAEPAANAPAYVARSYMNLDTVEGMNELRGYKHIRSIWPQGWVTDTSQPIKISLGSTDSIGSTPFYTDNTQVFDGIAGSEELFFQSAGRFHKIEVSYDGDQSFTLSGFDMDITKQGDR